MQDCCLRLRPGFVVAYAIAGKTKMRVALIPESQQAKEFGPEFGFFGAAAMHALGARRHMHEFGTTREHFGAIAMAFREHATAQSEPHRCASR